MIELVAGPVNSVVLAFHSPRKRIIAVARDPERIVTAFGESRY
jgi:hypothetical protein